MHTTTSQGDPVAPFCRAWARAHIIHVTVYAKHDERLVADIAEFGREWVDARPKAVSEFVAGRTAHIRAFENTGLRSADESEMRTLATLSVRAAQ